MLERADQQLERRLRREAQRFGPTERFTGAGLLAYRRQVQLVNAFVRARMDRNSRRSARRNIRQGWFDTVGLLGGLEEAYTGSVRPLRINTARMMNERTRGVQASLLRQHATSMDRYGEEMEREMRQTLQSNLLAGGSFSQAVDQLVAMRGPRGRVSIVARERPDGTVERIRLETIPEGLFRRHRWWAMRIVRTETAYAQNAAGFEALRSARDVDFPDMQKKILAMMDNRTAPDSIAVHGQIRELDATFRDGAGREYLHPPARPNDREVVIPWRPGWEETDTSAPRPSLEEAVERARAAAGTETLPEPQVAELIAEETPEQRAADLEQARRADRSALLRRRGFSDEAIERDAAEMGASEATPEAIRAQIAELAGSMRPFAEDRSARLTPARGRRLRQSMRRLIRTMDPSFASRDVLRDSQEGRYRVRRQRRRGASHGWEGTLHVSGDALHRAARAAVAMSEGRTPNPSDVYYLKTFIHEEHHGASPIYPNAYRGIGAGLEEATVELRARGFMGQIARAHDIDISDSVDLPQARTVVLASGARRFELTADRGSYARFVGPMTEAVAAVQGIPEPAQDDADERRETRRRWREVNEYVQQRLSGWFSPESETDPASRQPRIRHPDELLDRIAEMLHPEDPERMQRELRRRLR